MRIHRLVLSNVKSFKDETVFEFNNDFNILIGPNGGGKSNLLDIITISFRHFFLHSCHVAIDNLPTGIIRNIYKYNTYADINQLLDKYYDNTNESHIKFDFKIDKNDIDNIRSIQKNVQLIEEQILQYKYIEQRNILEKIKDWESSSSLLKQDDILSYEINNNVLITPTNNKAVVFLEYLNLFELLLILLKGAKVDLSTNFTFFSPFRGMEIDDMKVSLPNFNYFQSHQEIISKTSKSIFSLMKLATAHFSEKRRILEKSAKDIGYHEMWEKDEEVKLVSKYLNTLGYKWQMNLLDSIKNIYEITLERSGRNVPISQASAGEKEIINFLFGIFAMKLKNGIVIIDEPELHLHPKWQIILLDLFLDLAKLYNIQFILSTHSSSFINERTINHVFRIYKNNKNESRAVIVKDGGILNVKDILHIVHSTNNDKMFFCDVAVLVEGIIDKLIFQSLFEEALYDSNNRIVEIIEIKGKTNRNKFKAFLEGLKVPTFFIGDFDCVKELGTPHIKSLFATSYKKIEGMVIKDRGSKDGELLSECLDEAIKSEDLLKLKEIWEYIKSFRRTIKDILSPEEQSQLDGFIENLEDENNYILKNGDIEDYFPIGYKRKGIDKVLELLSPTPYKEWQKSVEYKTLTIIVDDILKKTRG